MSAANLITATILLELPRRFPGVVLWRNNRLVATAVGKGGTMRHVSAGINGQADLSGIVGRCGCAVPCTHRAGTRLEVEVKAGKDRMSLAQRAFREMITRSGGIYLIAGDDTEAFFAELGRATGRCPRLKRSEHT